LVGPRRTLNFTRYTGIANFPGPEEVILEIDSGKSDHKVKE